MRHNCFRGGFNVALQWLVGWLYCIRRPRYCIAWDIGLKDSFSVITKLRRDGSVEWVQVVDHKPANATHDGRRIRRTVDGIVGDVD